MSPRLEPLDHVTAEIIINDIDGYTSPDHVNAVDALAILLEVDKYLQQRIKVLRQVAKGEGSYWDWPKGSVMSP